jgi:hypothetical protein
MKTTKKNINNRKKNTKKNKGKLYLLKGGDNKQAEAEDNQEKKLKERVAGERDAAIKSCGNNNGWCVEQMEARYKDPGKEACNWTTGEGNCDGNLVPLYALYRITFRPMGYGIYWIVHKIAGFSIFSLAGFMEGVQTAYKIASENMEKKFTKIGDATKGAISSFKNLTMSNRNKTIVNDKNPMTGGRKTRRRRQNKTK